MSPKVTKVSTLLYCQRSFSKILHNWSSYLGIDEIHSIIFICVVLSNVTKLSTVMSLYQAVLQENFINVYVPLSFYNSNVLRHLVCCIIICYILSQKWILYIKQFWWKLLLSTLLQNDSSRKAGVDLIKLFWYKFTYSFCKLYNFIKMCYICCISIKSFSLQKRVSKFMPKKFYEIDPWSQKKLKFSTLILKFKNLKMNKLIKVSKNIFNAYCWLLLCLVNGKEATINRALDGSTHPG